MDISGNTVLITGGGTGIGLAIAEVLLKNDNIVIICGRRGDKLMEARKKFPQINIKICDITNAEDRKGLFSWVTSNLKSTNVLINNAGIQRMIDFTKGIKELTGGENEIITNLEAPIYLSALFIPHLLKQKEAAIINISSGLAFLPLAVVPVYSATKAAIHSFSLSLRHQLRDTPVKVFEIIPPIVDTELDKGSREKREQADRGIPPGDVALATLAAMRNNDYEAAIGMAENLRKGSRSNPEQIFKFINEH